MRCTEILSDHARLSKRKQSSQERLTSLRRAMIGLSQAEEEFTVFVAGSISRGEAGPNSDLDVFIIANPRSLRPLREMQVICKIAEINNHLKFPAFSDELRYMKIYDRHKVVDDTGKPRDDSENSFTTRMLLLLEGNCVFNESLYSGVVDQVCSNYFRDSKGKKDFRALFLINDILRYWRTLCLNYEQCREDASRPWRKKNMNLRFSRLTTVFSTVAYLLAFQPTSPSQFRDALGLTPIARLGLVCDELAPYGIEDQFLQFLNTYERFLQIKDDVNAEVSLTNQELKEEMRRGAEEIASFFMKLFDHSRIRPFSRYLIL